MTHEYPYHLVARSNNKEWFYLSTKECWFIFEDLLQQINQRFHFQTHAFVLMNNHYHLIGSASENYPLCKVMEWLQRAANRIINNKAGRINHLFGGPYKGSLITSEVYYYHALKYLYRNPVRAGMVSLVEDYNFSTLRKTKVPLFAPNSGIDVLVPKDEKDFLLYLNKDYSETAYQTIKFAVSKTEFKLSSRVDKSTKQELKTVFLEYVSTL